MDETLDRPDEHLGRGAAGGLDRAAPDELRCSAKGCHAAAAFELTWNNPRLHPPARRKIWLACPAHRSSLGDFLDRRGFLREVGPLAAAVPRSPSDRPDGPGCDRGDDALRSKT